MALPPLALQDLGFSSESDGSRWRETMVLHRPLLIYFNPAYTLVNRCVIVSSVIPMDYAFCFLPELNRY